MDFIINDLPKKMVEFGDNDHAQLIWKLILL